jgi:hypothetical protein
MGTSTSCNPGTTTPLLGTFRVRVKVTEAAGGSRTWAFVNSSYGKEQEKQIKAPAHGGQNICGAIPFP